MIGYTGFRGLNAAQKDIISHWNAVRGQRAVPGKQDIDPGALRAHLASISIIEVGRGGQATFRIAGSGLRRILGGEMRGRALSDLDSRTAAMWTLGLEGAIERGEPVGGLIDRTHDRHAWLRLPLESDCGTRCLVLCHDVLLAHEAADRPERGDMLSPIPGGLAA